MGPNVIYLLSCALGVVLPVTDCLPGWHANAPLARFDVADWRCLETACFLPFVPGQWEDWGIKTCIWMGLASVAVLAPMFEQTLAIEIE